MTKATCKRCGTEVPHGGYTVPRAEIKNADTVLAPDEKSILLCDNCYRTLIYKDAPAWMREEVAKGLV